MRPVTVKENSPRTATAMKTSSAQPSRSPRGPQKALGTHANKPLPSLFKHTPTAKAHLKTAAPKTTIRTVVSMANMACGLGCKGHVKDKQSI